MQKMCISRCQALSAQENVFDLEKFLLDTFEKNLKPLRSTHVLVVVDHAQGPPREQLRHVNIRFVLTSLKKYV